MNIETAPATRPGRKIHENAVPTTMTLASRATSRSQYETRNSHVWNGIGGAPGSSRRDLRQCRMTAQPDRNAVPPPRKTVAPVSTNPREG